jgi:hypothetical protein
MSRPGLAAAACFLCALAPTTLGWADEAAPEIPAEVAKPVGEKAVEKISAIPSATTASAPMCKPAHQPVYVEDWDRLVALTRSDAVVSPKAEFWAARHQSTSWVLAAGLILGGGTAGLGSFNRLSSGSWTTTSQWSVAGGISTALVSLFANWAFAQDRDDLLTVINHWNLRHPDQPLAP